MSAAAMRLVAWALALALAGGGWVMYARTARAWAVERATAEAQADAQRESNRGRARDAATRYKAGSAAAAARSATHAEQLHQSLQRPVPCPTAASAPDDLPGAAKMVQLADVLVPFDTVRLLIDAGTPPN